MERVSIPGVLPYKGLTWKCGQIGYGFQTFLSCLERGIYFTPFCLKRASRSKCFEKLLEISGKGARKLLQKSEKLLLIKKAAQKLPQKIQNAAFFKKMSPDIYS